MSKVISTAAEYIVLSFDTLHYTELTRFSPKTGFENWVDMCHSRGCSLWQDIAVKTCFLIAKWMSYGEVINVLINWHYIAHSSIICLHSYVIRMYIYVFVGDRSSDHRPMIARLSSDCRAMNGRCKTEEFPWAVNISNVNARHRPIWESQTW